MDNGKTGVLVVDDHSVVRNGLKYMMDAFEDIVFAGEAADGAEALRCCEDLQPDVVLMDLKMDGMDGVSATQAIKENWPELQILILSSFHDQELVQAALDAGAVGYLLKTSSMQELGQAIRAAHRGNPTYDSKVTEALLNTSTGPAENETSLTERQLDVLKLMARGCTNIDIALQLDISTHTVRYHTSSIFSRLGVANRAQAVALGMQQGLI